MPELYNQLNSIQEKLEEHYHDMQDMEFTVQEGKLWFLQTRNGKRTGAAMVKIAIDLLHQGMIDEKTCLNRIEPNKLDELLHPVFDKAAEKIYSYPEVKSVYLMSGGFDLALIIEGKTMKEVAFFVAQKLAPIEYVTSTATHFVLKKYKDKGVVYGSAEIDERGNCN